MRVVHLHGGTAADVEVSFHPQITVVRGLHDPARRWCIDTLGHLAVGRGAEPQVSITVTSQARWPARTQSLACVST